MGLLDQFKSLLEGKLSIENRYELLREAVSGTMSAFYMAKDKKTGEWERRLRPMLKAWYEHCKTQAF